MYSFFNSKFFRISTLFLSLAFLITAFTSTPSSFTKTITNAEVPASVSSQASPRPKTVLTLTPDASRTVEIYGPIGMQDDGSVAELVQRIKQLGQSEEPLYVLINSPGGSVLDGAMIISALEAAKGPVYTVCESLCASMAALIFEYGTVRYAVDRSLVMFHPASGGAGDGEIDKVASRLGSIQHYIGKMEAYVAKRAGLTYDQYKAKAGVELWIEGSDAVNSGFADSLVNIYRPGYKKPESSSVNHIKLPNSTKFDIDWRTEWFHF